MKLRLLNWFNQNDGWFRFLLFIFSSIPAVLLLWDFSQNQLGFNPFEALIARTGFWAMVYLLLTLAITPLRRWLGFICKTFKVLYGKRLADWNFLIKSRRMLGLFSFFYLCWHLGIYLHLELDWQADWFWEDVTTRPFLAIGIIAWFFSFLLAITSPMQARRKMGRNWRRLHRLMYPLCILAVVHVLMEAKITELLPLTYGSILLILLLHRILAKYLNVFYRPDDTGLEAKR